MNVHDDNCDVKVVFVNISGQAGVRVCATIAKYPRQDVYCFVETMLDSNSCCGITPVDGYDTHHCTLGPASTWGGPAGESQYYYAMVLA